MKYVAPIDPHVHLRGKEYDFDYADLGMRNAQEVGLCGMLEMPNCQPFLTTHQACGDRQRLPALSSKGIFVGINIGLTDNMDLNAKALMAVEARVNGVVADKTFYTHSTGNMGLMDPELQRKIWELKGAMSYNGVSMGHFEDEQFFQVPFDPANPKTHSLRQCPEAELACVRRQIKTAYDNNFQGTFYVCHCSNPDTIDFLTEEKRWMPFPIVIEATWHHMFLNWDDYAILDNVVKMNPPLRSPEMQREILKRVLNGKVDIIGTDHAPHPLARKSGPNPASGVPAIPFWPKGIELLRRLDIHEQRLENLIYRTANAVFRLGLPRREVERQYNPELWKQYGYNPFQRVDH